MAVFQQPPSATLPPPSTTHPPPTAFCLRQPFREGSFVAPPRLLGRGAPKIASFTTILAALWPAPSRYSYKYPFPTHSPSNTVLISTQTPLQKSPSDLPLYFLLFSSVVVPSHARRILLAIYRRTPNTGNHEITSESSCTSPIDTDNNRPFEPDSSETDLTELERSPPAGRTIARKKLSLKTRTKSLLTVLSNMELPEDYGRSNKTKKLKLRLKEQPSTNYKWGVTEDTLRKALPNNIYRFLNWYLKLEYSYTKASALKADWKYFRIYYQRVTKTEISKEIGEAVRTGIRYLVDKRGLDIQPRANVLDPHRGPPKPIIELEPYNTFTLPEIIYSVSLIFSPYILLFIILFYIYTFKAPHLISIEDLRRLLIEGGRQEILLPLKKEIDNYYIFPKVEETPINRSTLDAQLRISSEIYGFLNHFFSHQFRYRGGDLLDKSGFVSKAQRNIIIAHTTSRTFIKYYRPRRYTSLQEIIYGLNPDEEFLKARPSALIALTTQYFGRYWRTRSVKSTICAGVCKTNSGKKYTAILVGNRRQLTGGAVSDKPTREVLRKEFEILSEQILLPTTDLLEDEWTRRNKAVAAGIQYCSFQEGRPLKGRRKRSAPSDNKDIVPSPPARKEKGYTSGGKYIPNTEQIFVYFQYPKTYSDYNRVKRYFRILYLTDRIYNFCDLSVLYEIHLRRYTEDIYSLRT
ncbi:uncharacterized protein N7479_006315 [Penicillium vulpinum]|uniref:uncharacterized protein n=1 Tax=Penicillium vulpinum TaxID=29845 RepID=UPI002549844E|nr:uncharacterized protein N7479_006315 [Penicillium vulpinum]KAJ5959165.1 hypothetical protein N7479_006315 [Penicillium vulpinum]